MEFLTTFDNLKHGDKMISPTDNEVTEFLIANDGEKYLANKTCMYNYVQFTPSDFCMYTGDKEVGEVDKEYFNRRN